MCIGLRIRSFIRICICQIDVAVKILHDDDKVNKKNFLKEAEVMMNLNHLYIVKFIGVCHGPPVAMVSKNNVLLH